MRLVAMENTLFADPALDWDRRCALIAEAGFTGVYAVPYPLTDAELARSRRLGGAPARHGLCLSGIYANIDLALPPTAPWNDRVRRLCEAESGAPRIELSFKCSDPAATPSDLDGAIAARLEPLLDLAERGGFHLALYHHSFYPLETPEAAENIVRRIGHPRLGYVFATSHAYALWPEEAVVASLRACAARIASFNVCGCRRAAPAPPAKCRHFPLDEGELSLGRLWEVLAAGGYNNDVIVQGHGWTGELRAKLLRSVEALARVFPPNYA